MSFQGNPVSKFPIARTRPRNLRSRDRNRYRPMIELLEDRTLLDAMSWIGPTTGLWETPANWLDAATSANRVPTSGDDVTIAANNTVTVDDVESVNSLQCAGNLLVSAGSLQVAATSQIGGGLTLRGGDLLAFGPLTLAGNTSWQTGTIYYNGLNNTGTITLSGTADKTIAGIFNNNGTIVEQDAGNLVVTGTLKNNALGVIDIQSDTGITGNGVINNSGDIKKSAGTGTSSIGPSLNAYLDFNQLGGTLDAQSGTLQIDQTRTSLLETGGTWDAEGNAILDIVGNGPSGTYLAGTFTGTGTGVVMLDGGNFYSDTGGATFNFPTGLLQWTGGFIGDQAVTNAGSITLSGSADKSLGATLNNNGALVETGAGNLVVSGTLDNNTHGLIDIQSDAGITGNGVVNNSGDIKKSAGTGTSSIGPSLNTDLYFNQLGGTLDAQSGTLQIDQTRTSLLETGGTWDAEANAILDIVGNGPSGTYLAGTFTGSGAGAVQLDGGNFYSDTGGTTFNFPAGFLQWTGGFIGDQAVTNAGFITLAGSADKSLGATLNNNGALVETGAGNLVVSGTLDNNTHGLIDLQSDAGITGNGVVNNSGTIQKSAGTGVSRIGPSPNTDLYFDQFGGKLDAQTGTLQIDQTRTETGVETGGTWDAETNATLDIVGNGPSGTYLAGTFTGSGGGNVLLDGGNFYSDTGGTVFNFPAGFLQWTGGGIGGQTLTNQNVITLSGAADKGLFDTLDNDGTIIQTGAGNLILAGYCTINNQADGVYDFQSDAQINGTGTLNNAGVIRKTAGAGVSAIGPPDPISGNSYFAFNNTGGTLNAQSGAIDIGAGQGRSTGGTFNASANAVVEFTGVLGFSGVYTGSGAGEVAFAGGNIVLIDTGVPGANATFNFPAGLFHWTGGEFDGGEVTTPLTNVGFMTIDGPNSKYIYRNTIINQGTITDDGPGNLVLNGIGDFGGSTIDNQFGATFDIHGDANIVQSQANAGTFSNEGTLEKTAGSGISNINEFVNSTPSGAFIVQSGRLVLGNGGTFTGAAINIAFGAVLEFGPGFIFTMTGSYAGTGLGSIDFEAALSGGDDSDPAYLNFVPGYFNATGSFFGTVENDGTMTLNGNFMRAHFINAGTIDQVGTLDVDLNANTLFENRGLYDLLTDASIVVPGDGSLGNMQFVNSGILRKSGGTGTSQIRHDGNGKAFLLNNTGTVEVDSGTIQILDQPAQISGTTLTAGTWSEQNGASLVFPVGTNIVTNQGNLALDGAGATIAAIANLATNQGDLSLSDGANFTTVGDLASPGTLTLGPNSTLSVTGNLTLAQTSAVQVQIAGTSASGQFGQLAVAGQASLLGDLVAQLAGGFGPTQGDVYTILRYASAPTNFGVIAGLKPFFSSFVGAKNVELLAGASAANIAVASITPPAPTMVGQQVSIPFTVDNTTTMPIAGAWTDSVYLSPSTTFGPDAVLVARVPHTGGLAGLSNYAGTASAALPDLTDGDYHVIVVADSSDQVPDTNRADDTLVSTGTFHVQVPTLTLGASFSGMIADGQSALYRIVVPSGGGDLALAIGVGVARTADVYLRYAALPDSAAADESFAGQTGLNGQLVVANPQAGSYYVLVQGREGAATPQSFTLTPRLAGFEIRAVAPNQGSNLGQTTITVTGSGFTNTSTVSLVSGGVTRVATNVMFQASDTLFATFNLTGLSPGPFDVKVTNGSASTAATGAFTVDTTAPGHIEIQLDSPYALRLGAVSTAIITYQNTGGTDIPAPLLILSSDNAEFRVNASDLWQSSNIELLAYNPNGPAGILPPGATGSVAVQFLPLTQGPHVPGDMTLSAASDLTQTIDWASFESALQPVGLSNQAWAADYANFVTLVGGTLGSYQSALDGAATYLSQLGEYTPDVTVLQSYLLEVADDFGSISQRNTLGQFGYGVFGPNDYNVQTMPDGRIDVTLGNQQRLFDPNAAGSSAFHGEPGDAATAALNTATNMFVIRETDGSTETYAVTLSGGTVTSGSLTATQDANGNTTTYTANGWQDSLGNAETYVYNSNHLVSQITDPEGRVTNLTYNTAGDLANVSNAAGTTSFTYITGQAAVVNNALATVTFTDGTEEFFQYDSLGRLMKTNFASGADPLTYTYNQVGVITITDFSGHQTVVSPNDQGGISRVEAPLGQLISAIFDANGNSTQITDPANGSVTATYDSQNNPTSITDPLGNTIGLTYNQSTDTRTSLTDPNGVKTTYTSDSHGNLKTITYADGTTEQFQYNSVGNLISSTDQLGQTTTYTYNAQDLLTGVNYADGTSVTYTYDNHRNLATATDASGATTFTYDAGDRLSGVTYPNGMSVQYGYNAFGQRTTMTASDGSTVKYGYDPLGRLISLTDGSGNSIVTYGYNSVGQLAQENMGNQTSTAYGYDANGNVTSVVNSAPGGAVISSFTYVYNALGLPVKVTTLSGATTYGYDADGQLTSVSLPSGETILYQYDAAGNRVSVTDNGVTTAYTTNNMNEYTAAGTALYTYNLAGQVTSMTNSAGMTTYGYNAAGKLVSVNTPTDAITYQYDALGNLLSSTDNGQVTTNLIDPTGLGNVIAQYTGNTLAASYTYGLGLTSQVSAAGAAYYAFDLTGNTVDLTGSNGTVLNTYAYLPFGTSLGSTGTTPNPFTFVGQAGIMTDASGLQYMRNRFYDASVGRFTEPDPTGLNGGDVNLYRYVWNSPVRFIDPSGDVFVGAKTGIFSPHWRSQTSRENF